MNTRGQGRVFQRGAYLWVAYYSHGKEERDWEADQRRAHRRQDCLRAGEGSDADDQAGQYCADRARAGVIRGEAHGQAGLLCGAP